MQGRRRSETLDEQLLYTAVPVVQAGRTAGAVRVTQSVTALDREVRRDQYALVGIGALALAVRARRRLVRGRLAGAAAGTSRSHGPARRPRAISKRARAVEGSAEQQEVARAFNTMADRLTHALEAQREFVANASHQLRTPLTGLRLRIEAADMANDRSRRARGSGRGRGRDAATGSARHESAHAGLGRRARAAERAGRPRATPRARPRRAGAAAPSRKAAASSSATADPAIGLGNGDDIATSLDNLIENALVHTPGGHHRDDHVGR